MKRKKARPSSLCAYCAKSVAKTEVEHVFPESWYPDDYPQSGMLTVPACSKCNRDYGRLEERLFMPFAVTLDGDPFYQSVVARALKSVDPSAAKGIRDISYRVRARRRALRQLEVLTLADTDRTLWSPQRARQVLSPTLLTTPSGLVTNGVPGIRFNPEDMSALGVKLMRGAFFAVKRRPLPAGTPCDARAFSNDATPVWESSRLNWNEGGQPPFEGRYTFADEDDTVTLWQFRLWGRYVITASSGFANVDVDDGQRTSSTDASLAST